MRGIDGHQTGGSTAHRVRSVLAIPAFRRLWTVTALCAVGDWLSLLALSALATQLTTGYAAQSFALGGVVAIKLLPAMLLGPLAGALADKLDRRRVMVTCDVLRAGLFLSIPLVGSLGWLFVATLLIEICALFWIPAKDASIPNLLRRPDQVETANQLTLVMTYGVAVLTASALFTALSQAGPILGRADLVPTATGAAHIALVLNGLAYAALAVIVATRIPEISGRPAPRHATQPGLLRMLREGFTFVGRTPLVRGLVVGIVGAFAAGGAVIACARLYAASLGGGDGAYGLLFAAMFTGLGIGMATAPQASRLMPHSRLFGIAIVAAGLALVAVALAPHLFVALAVVALVGTCAGIAFLTGLTIIGAQVDDAVRGRTVAFVQSLVRVDLLASMALVPVLVALVQPRTLTLFGEPFLVDGTRPVLLGAGVVAALVGVVAYHQMGDRRPAPILADLRAVLRRRGSWRTAGGLLVAVEGHSRAEATDQADRLAGWLRAAGRDVLLAADPAGEEAALRAVLDSAGLSAARAQALAAAAVRAEVVERQVRPALAAGRVVVMPRNLPDRAERLDASGAVSQAELDTLADWATGRLRPDLTVLLDRPPMAGAPPGGLAGGEQHWRVQRILTEMSADSDRYVVIDADGAPETVAARVREAVTPVLRVPLFAPAPAKTTG